MTQIWVNLSQNFRRQPGRFYTISNLAEKNCLEKWVNSFCGWKLGAVWFVSLVRGEKNACWSPLVPNIAKKICAKTFLLKLIVVCLKKISLLLLIFSAPAAMRKNLLKNTSNKLNRFFVDSNFIVHFFTFVKITMTKNMVLRSPTGPSNFFL